MTEYENIIERLADVIENITGVPVYHAPAASAGEKIIYRCTPGRYDGDFETFGMTVKFLSADVKTAFGRAEKVSRYLCGPGDRGVLNLDRCPVCTVREEGGGSGYIGRTGYCFVTARFEISRRLGSIINRDRGISQALSEEE